MFRLLLSALFLIPALAQGSYTTKGDTVSYGLTHNVGITYGTSVLTITAANGSALTTANPAKVAVASVTSGQTVVLDINDATHLFDTTAGSSDIQGEEFGEATGVAVTTDRDFYLYAVNKDDTSANLEFAISQNPDAKESPATTNCGYHENPAATPSFLNFFFLTSVDVTATHNEKPCLLIGRIRMQMSVLDNWTVQTLDVSKHDGAIPVVVRVQRRSASVRWTGGAGKADGSASGTWEAFSDADFATDKTYVGAAVPETTNDLRLTVANLPAGKYKLVANGALYVVYSSDSRVCGFAGYDGTNRRGYVWDIVTATKSHGILSGFTGIFEYTELQSSLSFTVQTKVISGTTGTCNVNFDSTDKGFELSLVPLN